MSIVIGADIVPTKSNMILFENGDVDALVGKELMAILKNADYRIVNLEVPLTDVSSPIDKGGHNMIATSKSVNALTKMKIDLVSLSNNHILDQGIQGLRSTCKVLEKNGIQYVGVGESLKASYEPIIFEYNKKKIGVYACAEHEFSIATENSGGANPFDPLETPDHIADLREKCDYVIVLYHGGKEHYQYPSPDLQKRCQKLVSKGASLVICQHSHCIGCEERFLGSTIVYGQGNFIFDKGKNPYWNTSVLVVINEDFTIDYIPIVRNGAGVSLANADESERIMKGLEDRSDSITKKGFVRENYKEFAKKSTGYYFLELKGNAIAIFLFRIINRLSKQRFMNQFNWKIRYNSRHYCAVRNYIECEAHRELILTAMRK